MSELIEEFTWHGSEGHSVLVSDWLVWVDFQSKKEGFGPHNGYGFGKLTHLTWLVNNKRISIPADAEKSLHLLPDASGFLSIERPQVPDNCTLLDAYAHERMRLTVPWQLTVPKNPASNTPPTSFWGISEPFANPTNGELGRFGMKAWVELGGEYYFELDWRTGEFLWGKEIRF